MKSQDKTKDKLIEELESLRLRVADLEAAQARHENTERALRESEDRFQSFMDNSPVIAFMKDDQGRFLYVNRRWEQEFGRTLSEVRGMLTEEVWPGKPGIEYREHDRRVLDSGETLEFVEKSLEAGGDVRYWRTFRFPMQDSKGQRFTGSVAVEITNQVKTEESLRESEKRFRLAMEASADGIWDWDISTGATYYSPSYFSMLGLEPGEYPEHVTTWLDLMHPEDRDHALAKKQDCISGEKEYFAVEFRMLHNDGSWRWILGRGKCVARDPQGKATRLVGTHTDITGRKEAEEELRIRDSAIMASINGINFASPDGTSLYANNTFVKMWGFDRHDDAIGLHVSELWDDKDAFSRAFAEFEERGFYSGELRARRRDGTTFDAQLSASTVFDDGIPLVFMASFLDITDRKKSDEALRKANDELELRVRERTAELKAVNKELLHEIAERKTAEKERDRLFNRSIDLLCVAGLDGFFRHVNPAWCAILGWTEEDLLSKPWIEFVHPEDREATESARGNLIDGVEVYAFENRYVTKDGTYRWLSWNSFPVPEEGAIYAVARDVTERKKIEEALRKSEEFNRRLVDHAPFGIAYLSGNGTIEYVNPAANRIMGVPESRPSPVMGLNVLRLPGVRDPSEVEENFRKLLRGESLSNLEVPYKSSVGRETVLLVAATPRFGADGTVEGAVLMFTDISERKRAEELQRETVRFRAVADLAGGVAHNFNNLLHIVMGHLELALMDLEAGEYGVVRDSLQKVLKSSRYGAEVVRRLQRLALANGDIQGSETGVFDLSDVAGQAVDVSKSWLTAAEKEGRRVSLYTRLKEGCLVNGDQDVIFGAIINLVRNALEALPTGGDVDLTTTVEGNKVVLRVKDTGIGINRENLARVFNPFFTTKAEAGAGLSLASTRKIVENFGGRILVDSVEGQGTTFTLLFPLAERLPEPTKALHDLEPAERLTIMVIDDMVELTDLMKSALTAYGHAVLTANSGEEAIEIFQDNPADVVICDLGMPGMTGWDVGRCVTAICHERGAPKPPFVLLTAWANQEVETEKIARSGVDAVIGKPLNIRIILEVIREVVEKSHSAVSNE